MTTFMEDSRHVRRVCLELKSPYGMPAKKLPKKVLTDVRFFICVFLTSKVLNYDFKYYMT